jgi:hypothetical protein
MLLMAIMRPGSDCPIFGAKRVAIAGSGGDAPPPEAVVEKTVRSAAANYTTAVVHSGITQTITFFVHNPSPRLRLSVSVGFEFSDNSRFAAGSGTPTWQLQAVRIPADGGPTADLDTIFVNSSGVATARNLPDGYEADTATKDYIGTLTLHDTAGVDYAQTTNAALVIEGRWEPHDGEYLPNLAQLLARADLRVQGSPVTLGIG